MARKQRQEVNPRAEEEEEEEDPEETGDGTETEEVDEDKIAMSSALMELREMLENQRQQIEDLRAAQEAANTPGEDEEDEEEGPDNGAAALMELAFLRDEIAALRAAQNQTPEPQPAAPSPAQHFPPAGPEAGRLYTELSKVQTGKFPLEAGPGKGESLHLPEQFIYQGTVVGPGEVRIDTSGPTGRAMHAHLTGQVERVNLRNEERAAVLKREGINAAPPVPVHQTITDPEEIARMTVQEPERREAAGSGGP
jgi:hypothetical protein